MSLTELSRDPILLWVLAGIVTISAILLIYFIIFFLIPSFKLRTQLVRINTALPGLKDLAEKKQQVLTPDTILKQVMTDEPFKHLWSEYAETLHRQRAVVDGEEKLVSLRATYLAEAFFTYQTIVDTALRTEFFKHLPGIFTGIGIIGTFSGLILGLSEFQISDVPAEHVRAEAMRNLRNLITHVAYAFIVSAGAITIAMFLIFFEKVRITSLYREVEFLCRSIDSLYVSGVGEEYLARLVRASEESATQTTHLKDSLVADLKQMMTNLVDRQIQATQASQEAVAANISQSMTESLREPMASISRVVHRASEDQGVAVQRTLSDIISGFMTKMEEVFGGQISGLNSLMQETTASMRDTRDRFNELVENLSGASRSAGEAMAEQLTRAMESAALRQREMNNQMQEFVGQIRDLISQSQSETSNKVTESLQQLGSKVSQVVGSLSDQQAQAGEVASQRQTAIAEHAQTVVSGLGGKVNELNEQTAKMVQATQQAVGAMRQVTLESVDRLNVGAERLQGVLTEFTNAGQGVSRVFEQATQVTGQLSVAATGLVAASRAVEASTAAYNQTRGDLVDIANSLREIVEAARRDAGVSEKLVNDLDSAAKKFGTVQRDAGDFLGKVSGVLSESFEKYIVAMKETLDRTRTEVDASLARSVEMLRSTIDDLSEALERLPRS